MCCLISLSYIFDLSSLHSLNIPPLFLATFYSLFPSSLIASQPTNREGPLIDLPQVSCPSNPPSPPPTLPSLAQTSLSQPAPDKKGQKYFSSATSEQAATREGCFHPQISFPFIPPGSLDIHYSQTLKKPHFFAHNLSFDLLNST